MKVSEHYIVRDYKKGDEAEITTLFFEVFGKEMSIEQWNWKYLHQGNGRVYSKVVEDPSGKIVGHAGAIPLKGIFKGKLIPVFQIVDVMVHAKARGYLGRKNVFEILIKNLFENIGKEFPDVFCYGFPGTRPFILGKRIGVYDKVEQAVENYKYLRRSLFNPYRVKIIVWNDDRLDGLWKSLSTDFPLSLIRDKSYLNWRYAMNPFFSYQLFGFFLLGNLKGWVVIRDLKDEVLVIDLFTESKRYISILKALENYLIAQGKKTIRFWLPEKRRKYIKGYSVKETPIVVTNMVWKLPVQTHVARESLYYTMGDADIF